MNKRTAFIFTLLIAGVTTVHPATLGETLKTFVDSVEKMLAKTKDSVKDVIASFKDVDTGEYINEKTKQKMWYASVELPGYKDKDIKVNIEVSAAGSKRLDIHAKKATVTKTKTSAAEQLKEKQHSISMPRNAEETKSSRTFKNGVLRIEIPLKAAAEEKSKTITVPHK
jgi:HSP20 family molecular chaperone IbpA